MRYGDAILRSPRTRIVRNVDLTRSIAILTYAYLKKIRRNILRSVEMFVSRGHFLARRVDLIAGHFREFFRSAQPSAERLELKILRMVTQN